jgi:diadenosine tetraphosphate (Ap4A) HIT family hydrolase
MPTSCPFCRKLAGTDSWPTEDIVWPFPHSIAVLGTWQFYHGYCVLISRRHASELSQLDDAERSCYLDEMCTLARAIEQAFKPRKVNYELLGNQVPHLHWHLLPRYQEDVEHLKPVWIALERAEHDPDERDRLQSGPLPRGETIGLIRKQLQQLTTDE